MRAYRKGVIRKSGFSCGKFNADLQGILFPARKEIKCVFKGGGHIMGFLQVSMGMSPCHDSARLRQHSRSATLQRSRVELAEN
jgi:hypothetical protein